MFVTLRELAFRVVCVFFSRLFSIIFVSKSFSRQSIAMENLVSVSVDLSDWDVVLCLLAPARSFLSMMQSPFCHSPRQVRSCGVLGIANIFENKVLSKSSICKNEPHA